MASTTTPTVQDLQFVEFLNLFIESEKDNKLHPFEEDEDWTFDKYKKFMLEQYRLAHSGDIKAKEIIEKTQKMMRLARSIIGQSCPICKK